MTTSALGRIALAAGLAVLTSGALPAPAHAAGAPVKRRILPVLVEFTDSSFQFPDKVKASTPDTYFGAKNSAASFLSEVSRGQYTMVPAVKEQFLGPIKLAMPAAGCDTSKINQLTRARLAEQGLVDGKDYDSLSMVFPAQRTGCAWAGLATVPGGTTWINLYGTASGIDVVGHELGHNLGFAHQGRQVCSGGDLSACKADGGSRRSIMGGGGHAAGFSAPELIRAGWLSGGTALKVTKSGTYTLRSLHGTGSGTRALDIALGRDRLVLAYRHAAGTLDAGIEGVHAYRVPKGAYGSSSLIDPPRDSDKATVTTLTDKKNKVSLEVVSAGGGRATVRVALGGAALPGATPTPSKSSPAPRRSVPASPTLSVTPSAGAARAGSPSGSAEPVVAAGPDPDLAATDSGHGGLPLAAAGGAGLLASGVGALVLMRQRKPVRSAIPGPRSHRRP